MARRPQTPLERKRAGILLMVLAAILLIFGISLKVNYQNLKRQCSASAIGTVANVESKRVRRRSRYSSNSHTEYKAHIVMAENAPFGTRPVTSRWTRTHYHTGQSVTVFYNPDDLSTYYVEGAAPQNGNSMFLMAAVFIAFGIIQFAISVKDMRPKDDPQQEWN